MSYTDLDDIVLPVDEDQILKGYYVIGQDVGLGYQIVHVDNAAFTITCRHRLMLSSYPRPGYISYTASVCDHSFPDTGFRKSWCRHCDVEGVWNPETCAFSVR